MDRSDEKQKQEEKYTKGEDSLSKARRFHGK
jgi:hypothetical protein